MDHITRCARRWLALAVAGALCAGAAAAASPDRERGKAVFANCAACHSLQPGDHLLGPSLHDIVGRKAGSTPGFRYSGAVLRSGVTWTPATLDKYLEDPQKYVAGNRMSFSGIPDAADRKVLIDYLQDTSR